MLKDFVGLILDQAYQGQLAQCLVSQLGRIEQLEMT